MVKINNPHDKVVRETLSRKDTAVDFFNNYLPKHILDLIDMNTLEISKDSFIEKELEDYYSDLLYKVMFKDSEGFIYLLFEHKSYPDAFIQLQLFGYIHQIYSLYVKQTKPKKLPVIVPMVLYHGRNKWEISTQFSSIIQGPHDILRDYVPDFKYILLDLTQHSDEEIKGEVQARIFLLLLKHIFDDDIFQKLPDILSLFNEVMKQDTGLQTIETLLRYLFSTIQDENMDKVKNILDNTLSHEKGGSVMATIAEKFINEGIQQGLVLKAKEDVVEALELRFGTLPESIKNKLNGINDPDKLKALLRKAITIQKFDDFKNYC